jgi:hypothetical protein
MKPIPHSVNLELAGLFKHPLKSVRKIERCLPAKLHNGRPTFFMLIDIEDVFECQRLEIKFVVCRHVYDAPTVTDSTLTVLQHCLQRMVQERTFDANSYRAGEINSRTLWYFRCCWCCHLQLIRGAAHLEIGFAVNSRSRVPVLQLSRGAMASHFCRTFQPLQQWSLQ